MPNCLDASAAALLSAFGDISPGHRTPEQARADERAAMIDFGGSPGRMSSVTDHAIEGPGGTLPMRLYRPALEKRAAPCVLFLHGGGFVSGDLDTHHAMASQIAARAGCLVTALGYRLAPEHPFPAALEDAMAALRWLSLQPDIDPARLAVCGDSAGGNLAAVLAILARDGVVPTIRAQALIYPVCDLGMAFASYDLFATGYLLRRADMERSRAQYGADTDDWRASPLRAPSLQGVAPTLIITAGFDPLRDEGCAYAARLRASGVACEHTSFDGQVHGFVSAAKVIPEAYTALDQVGSFLKQELI